MVCLCFKCLLLVLDRHARDLHDEDGDVVHGLGVLHVDLRPRPAQDSARLRNVSQDYVYRRHGASDHY